ncbi:hypothetical protein L2E82_33784 [Cichorium intybus]|uniref:Uncharacterized protein n=1 Tax=Cichorium intybus TaxID=13427 RepID=A0ACB9BL32_CICIN|nr:hypothetical protein L2E82_33784 [Cichorium intybus]
MSSDSLLGLLRVHVQKGVNLAIRDLRSSDPYVIIRMGKQIVKTRVVRSNLNPVWDEELTLAIVEPLPVRLTFALHGGVINPYGSNDISACGQC